MKEIKFRQWINNRWKWHYWGFIGSGFTGPIMEIGSIEGALEKSQQYTGLKDKNGKESYRNDIIKYFGCMFIIEWDKENGCWYGEPFSNNETRGILSASSFVKSEIIGNIYENPELRKENK